MHVIAPLIGKVALVQKYLGSLRTRNKPGTSPRDKKSPGTRNPWGQEIPRDKESSGTKIPRDKNPPGNPGQELLVYI